MNIVEHMIDRFPDLKWVAQRYFTHPFRLKAFTALFGCRDGEQVRKLLERQDKWSPYREIRGLHSLRWMLFDPSSKNGEAPALEPPLQALVLSFVCDGPVSDVLGALVGGSAAQQLRSILEHCHGYDASTDLQGFIDKHSIPTGYQFRDLGPIHQDWNYAPDPTRFELEEAYAMQGRFETFYATSSTLTGAALRNAFARDFADDGFPWPLTRFERPVVGEQAAVRRFTDLAMKEQERRARESNDHLVRRALHAKAHGLLLGTFHVEPVADPAYAVGLFRRPNRFTVLLRPSNGEGYVQRDRKRDAHGLAMRVVLPESELAGDTPKLLLAPEFGQTVGHDFLLVDQPAFFVADIDALSLMYAIKRDDAPLGKALAGAGLVLRQQNRVRMVTRLIKTFSSHLTHPLLTAFHSALPFSLGDGHVTKYSVEPSDPKSLRMLVDQRDPNYLSTALAASLRDRPIELKFFLHVLSARSLPPGYSSLADVVEDGTLDWSGLGAQKVHAATIVIGEQDPTTAARFQDAEKMRFNPWHAFEMHRPIGSLNRARLAAHRASQRFRSVELQGPPSQLPRAAE